jgi:hypothetical protein
LLSLRNQRTGTQAEMLDRTAELLILLGEGRCRRARNGAPHGSGFPKIFSRMEKFETDEETRLGEVIEIIVLSYLGNNVV